MTELGKLDSKLSFIKEQSGSLEDGPEAYSAELRYDFEEFVIETRKAIQSQQSTLQSYRFYLLCTVVATVSIALF